MLKLDFALPSARTIAKIAVYVLLIGICGLTLRAMLIGNMGQLGLGFGLLSFLVGAVIDWPNAMSQSDAFDRWLAIGAFLFFWFAGAGLLACGLKILLLTDAIGGVAIFIAAILLQQKLFRLTNKHNFYM